MNLIEIFSILLIHWIADFIIQTDKQAKGKSKEWQPLIAHTWTYSMCWFIVGAFLQGFTDGDLYPKYSVALFVLITFICHTITDYFTSRLNSRLWQQQKTHLFFVSIGFDQYLHYVQLFLTYWFLAGKN